MYRMSGRHTGKHLARELEALLKSFGIEKKVCPPLPYSYGFFGGLIYAANKIVTIVCDNASNNDTMIKELDLEGFRGTGGPIWCFPHILNLSVKVLWHHLIYACSYYSRCTKAILSQFANKLDDSRLPNCASTSKKRKKPPSIEPVNRWHLQPVAPGRSSKPKLPTMVVT